MIRARSIVVGLILAFSVVVARAQEITTTNRDCLAHFWHSIEHRPGPTTVLSFGDSMADSYRSIAFVLMNRLVERFGIAGHVNNYRNAMLWRGSNGAQVVGPSSFWFTDHFEIPAGGSVYWESDPVGGVMSTRAGLFYVAHPTGGQMDLLISTNLGSWTPMLAIDAYSPEPIGRYTSIDLALNKHRLRVDARSGTNYLIGPQLLNTLTNGVQAVFVDKGGISLGTVTNAPLNIRGPIFAALKPDLIIWHMKEKEGGSTQPRLVENEEWWRQAVPEADVLYIGTPWDIQDLTNSYTFDQNSLVRSTALAYHRAFVDCATPGISYTWLADHGYMADLIHPNLAGNTYLANIAWDDLNFFALRQPQTLALAMAPGGGGVSISFLTGRNISYHLEQSLNLIDWTSLCTVAGTGAAFSTNLPLVLSDVFFRLRLSP